MVQPTQLDPAEQDALVKQIGLAMLRAAPEDWDQITVDYRAVGRYAEAEGEIVYDNDEAGDWPVPQEIGALFARLRAGMYREGRGTWFNAKYRLDHPSSYNLDYDREEPEWTLPPPAAAFADELRMFPRTDANTPDWLRRHAAGTAPPEATRHRFRVARIFDGPGADGRPSVSRPPVPDADRAAVLGYLNAGPLIMQSRALDVDRLDPEGRPLVPIAFHTDGTWIWPAAVNYYLHNYGIAPEPDLMEHMRRNGFRPPEVDEPTRGAASAFIGRSTPAPPPPPRAPAPPPPVPAAPPLPPRPPEPRFAPEPAPEPPRGAPIPPPAALPSQGPPAVTLDTLRVRLAELGVPLSAYRIGAPADGTWTLDQTPEGWRVGWYEREFVAPAVFEDVADAAAFLLGKVLLDGATRAPGRPGEAAFQPVPPAGPRPATPPPGNGLEVPDAGRQPRPRTEPGAGRYLPDQPEPSTPANRPAGPQGGYAPPSHAGDSDPAQPEFTQSSELEAGHRLAGEFMPSGPPQPDYRPPSRAGGHHLPGMPAGGADPAQPGFPPPDQRSRPEWGHRPPGERMPSGPPEDDYRPPGRADGGPADGADIGRPGFTPPNQPDADFHPPRRADDGHHLAARSETGDEAEPRGRRAAAEFRSPAEYENPVGEQPESSLPLRRSGARAPAMRQPADGEHVSLFTPAEEATVEAEPVEPPVAVPPPALPPVKPREPQPTMAMVAPAQSVAVRDPEPSRLAAQPAQRWPIQPLPGEPPLTLFRGKRLVELAPGTEVDRFGEPDGNLTYAAGTPFPQRSLVPEWVERPFHTYRVARPMQVLSGTAIPWFEQDGGGTAYLLPAAIADLLADGRLVEVPGRPRPA